MHRALFRLAPRRRSLAFSLPITVVMAACKPADEPPSVTIDLVDGAVLAGEVTITATAADDVGVDKVEFSIDGAVTSEVQASPHVLVVDTCGLSSGAHDVGAAVFDTVGQDAADSASVTVQQPLAVRLEHSGALASPDDRLVVVASWDAGVDSIVVHVGDTELESVTVPDESCSEGCLDRCGIFSIDWDTRSLADGVHDVDVTLFDLSGRSAVASLSIEVNYDTDGDGFRTADAGGPDCDDGDNAVHPGVVETCNGIDDDCSGATDEPFDIDADGFPVSATCATSVMQDCDDGASAVNPDAAEVCGDGVDGDCDGPEECRVQVVDMESAAAATIHGTNAFSYLGMTLRAVGDLDGDGSGDLAVGGFHMDCEWLLDDNCGAIWVVDILQSGDVVEADVAVKILGKDAGEEMGRDAVPLGDADADGQDDVLILRATNRPPLVFLGPLTGVMNSTNAWATLATTRTNSAVAGDFNGDGNVDVVNGGGAGNDVAAVFLGPLAAGTVNPAIVFYSPEPVADQIEHTASSDLDADGVDEVLLAAPNTLQHGTVWAYSLADTVSEPTSEIMETGHGLANPGDLEGDGYGNFVSIDPMLDRVLVFNGPMQSLERWDLADASVRTGTPSGNPVSNINVPNGPADVDGDGTLDLVVGNASAADVRGEIYVLYGPVAGVMDVASARRIQGPEPAIIAAGRIALAGDVDGDGTTDLWTNGVYYDGERGAAFLILGQRE